MGIYSDILLTVDYDRTLTAPDSTIPKRNLEAIRYFMDQGGAFTVNTGRSVPMAGAFQNQVPVNVPLLLYNGSAAFDPKTGKLSLCREIELDLWDTVMECTRMFPDLAVEVQGEKAHYQISRKPGWEAFCDYSNCPRALAEPGQDLGPFLKFSLYGAFREANVSNLFSGTPEEMKRMDEAEQALRRRFGEKLEVFRAGARIIDAHAKGVGKGKAARALQNQLGRGILVCVGDSYNDLPMLQEADFAYVPGDCPLRDRYESVCDCADGAVADVIEKKLPEILKRLEKST